MLPRKSDCISLNSQILEATRFKRPNTLWLEEKHLFYICSWSSAKVLSYFCDHKNIPLFLAMDSISFPNKVVIRLSSLASFYNANTYNCICRPKAHFAVNTGEWKCR